MRTLKVAICIPCYGDPKAGFMQSLVNMVVYSLSHADLMIDDEPAQIEIDTYTVMCSMLTESRHKLVAEAMGWEADYMLCLDADHMFPPDTLMRLLSHGLPIVGCNYARRATPTAPTAAIDSSDDDGEGYLYTTEEKAKAGLVEPCAHLGFGVLLIDMRVFDALQTYADAEWGGNFLPLFLFEPTPDKIGMVGEDVYFFRKLKAAGIVPFCDHALSWEVGHISEIVLTNAHALAQKEKWTARRAERQAAYTAKVDALEARARQGELADGE